MSNKKIKYLDPKNDLTFRRIFGEHPHILRSFLNSLLPLAPNQQIVSLEYLEPELIPELPNLKRSVVDVNCKDNFGRYFIVEMQMYWTSAFKQRMLFNGSKAYVRQLKKKEKYRELKPVYGLSLVDDIYLPEYPDIFYHHYQFVHREIDNERIEGLEFVFIELPKFKARNITDKKMQTLWLRFLTEIDEETEEIPEELYESREIEEALEYLHESAFSEEELQYYEEYWDAIRIEKAAIEELSERYEEISEKYNEVSEKYNKVSEKYNEVSEKYNEVIAEKERKEKELEQERLRAEQERREKEKKEKELEQERLRAEQERKEKEQERLRAEQERLRAEQERQRAEEMKIKSVLKFYDKDFTIEEIAETLGTSVEEVNQILRDYNILK